MSNTVKNQRRLELIAMSKAVKPLVEMDQYPGINEAIKALYYNNVHLDTFNGWKEKGFSVKKGEKAKVVWGSPKPYRQKDAEAGEKETEFFPVCYLFSLDQVHKSETVECV